MHPLDHRLVEEAARDARLVRDHHHADAGPVERTDGVDCSRDTARPARADRGSPLLRSSCRRDRETQRDAGHHTLRIARATAPTLMPRMQRCVSGHSRSMHGRHQTVRQDHGARAPARPRGRVAVRRSVRTSRSRCTPSAAPRCIAPESFETSARQRTSTPASAGRSVRPIRLSSALLPDRRDHLVADSRRPRGRRQHDVRHHAIARQREVSPRTIAPAIASRRRRRRPARARPAALAHPTLRPRAAPSRRGGRPATARASARADRWRKPSARTRC